MRRSRTLRIAALTMLVAAACSTEGPPVAPAAVGSITGTARSAAATEADVDTADPRRPPGSNDDAGAAQQLPSAVTVGGWASAASDPSDYYLATLAEGQVVTLTISDWSASQPGGRNLDLDLRSGADPDTIVSVSAGTTDQESVIIGSSGEYYIHVIAFAGSSNYVLTLGQAASAAAPIDAEPDAAAEFVPGEVIVRFRDGAPSAAAAQGAAARAASVGLVHRAGDPRQHMLMAIGGGAGRARAMKALGLAPEGSRAGGAPDALDQEKRDTVRVVKALRQRADVESADLNYIRHATVIPDDPGYPDQWHYALMSLPEAWDLTRGTPDVIVAVVDTGVLLGHPDLAGKFVGGYDFVSSLTSSRDGTGPDPDPNDPGDSTTRGHSTWHGTHVAGTIGAATDNGIGVAGVAWDAKVMPVRVLGLNGSGTSFDIIEGVRFAAGLPTASGASPAREADVINLSLGGLGRSDAEQAVYDQVRAAGVLVVAAAGNANSSVPLYPASYRGVISVSAVDLSLGKAPYSNFGPNVDVAAPGGSMRTSTDPNGVFSTVGDDATGPLSFVYGFMQGTSMASPHVAGVVALMRAVCPGITPQRVDGLIAGGTIAQDLGAIGRDDVFGHGLLDAFAAVQVAQATCSDTATLDATPARLDFGPSGATSTLVTVSRMGSGTLGEVAFSTPPPWLQIAEEQVDAQKFGTYRFTVDASALPPGSYSAIVTFTAAPVGVSVPVTLRNGNGAGTGSAGHLYVLLVDANLDVVGQAERDASAGEYAYAFQNVRAGEYYIVAGSDADDDGFICDAGESCGAYPTLGQPEAVSAGQNPAGIDFLVGYGAILGGTSADRSTPLAIPPGGVRLLAPPKRAGAGP
jgi:serine protease